jgi:superfamily II DNA/RNA helicase
LDKADRLLEEQFLKDLLAINLAMNGRCARPPQTLMFSATISLFLFLDDFFF